MKNILECIAKNDLHEALVRCWKLLESDFPLFQKEESEARNQDANTPYQQQKKRFNKILLANEHIRIRDLSPEYPLAFLEVLDEYLFNRFSFSAGLALQPQVLLGGESYVIHRRVLQRSLDAAHSGKTGHLQCWLRYHWIVPLKINGIEIRFRSATGFLNKATHQSLTNGSLKIHVGSFADHVQPIWLDTDPNRWSTRSLTDTKLRWKCVLRALEEALAAGARIVVFPELTLCPDLRRKVIDWLDDQPDHSLI